jgi:hypothetical protein
MRLQARVAGPILQAATPANAPFKPVMDLGLDIADGWAPIRRGLPAVRVHRLSGSEIERLEARAPEVPTLTPINDAPPPVVFFNDRETVWPGEMTKQFRVLSRDANQPLWPNNAHFQLAASHSTTNRRSSATFGARFENHDAKSMTLALDSPALKATFGRLASQDALGALVGRELPVFGVNGASMGTTRIERVNDTYQLVIPAGGCVDVALMRLAPNWFPLPTQPPLQWGAYALDVAIVQGASTALAVHEVGRFDQATETVAKDPWEGVKAADPLAARKRQRHQQGRFVPVTADAKHPVVLNRTHRLALGGYNFGTGPADHQFAYHVDHTAYVAITGNPTLRFRGNGGFVNPFIGGKKWAAPGLNADRVLDIPLAQAVQQGLLRAVSPGVYRLDVRFDDNDNMNLELSLA